ncbi:MAG: damage-control phosphatase ARMT1 family protein [Myxococcota bacterium]|nr:damage-control phosphatase ARMT1 family protein [Myxococcota bacterium]
MTRPPPLRTDGSNAFARHSMQERVPRIAREVIARNQDYAPRTKSAIERLASGIEQNTRLPAARVPGPDVQAWRAARAEPPNETWLNAEWFYAELAFYRELNGACRFWELGRDPFAPVKDEELGSESLWSRLDRALGPTAARDQRVFELLDACLWGNRVDLSYTIAAARTEREDDDLLVDERQAALPRLVRKGAVVHLVADNAGTELAMDLALLGALLEDGDTRAALHLKIQPTFVSDAMPSDVLRLLEKMRARGGAASALASHLQGCIAAERLLLIPDPFWTGPLFVSDAPAYLRETLAAATIVVLKGDANYRRLVGDALWDPATPFARACVGAPAPLLCLRTMKSDPVLGLPEGVAERLDVEHPTWRIDGRRGVAQGFALAPGTTGGSPGNDQGQLRG